MSRISNDAFARKITSADAACTHIADGMSVGFSGFTGAGVPKAVPRALSAKVTAEHEAGRPFRIGVWAGASTSAELDGALAAAGAMRFRTAYQSDPTLRAKINDGSVEYNDIHLSHTPLFVEQGYLGPLDVAVVEVAAIRADGGLVPSTSVSLNRTLLQQAKAVVLEVNSWLSEDLYGMHDIFGAHGVLPPDRVPIPLTRPDERIGEPCLHVDPEKVVAVVETHATDFNGPLRAPDEDSRAIAGHLIDFLEAEVRAGRLPRNLNPIQSGVGNIANAVLDGLADSPFEDLACWTEVIQDGMINLLDSGKVRSVSATSFTLSPLAAAKVNDAAAHYRDVITLRPQDVSNHPELIRRLGVIAINAPIEFDIYGNVNSTHVMGSKMMNGIGGSGDFTRNAFLSAFVTTSTAKNGDISCAVPMVSHHDHTEHDVDVIVTERGLADLRGLAPRRRARVIIEKAAHPDYQPLLTDYLERAERAGNGLHTPHDLATALAWHTRFLESGSMRA